MQEPTRLAAFIQASRRSLLVFLLAALVVLIFEAFGIYYRIQTPSAFIIVLMLSMPWLWLAQGLAGYVPEQFLLTFQAAAVAICFAANIALVFTLFRYRRVRRMPNNAFKRTGFASRLT